MPRDYRQQLSRGRAQDVENALPAMRGPGRFAPEAGDHWARLRAPSWMISGGRSRRCESGCRFTGGRRAKRFLRDRVIPKREVILAISDQIRALDHCEAFEAEHRAQTRVFTKACGEERGGRAPSPPFWAWRDLRSLATRATRDRLESQIREQHRHILANARDLRDGCPRGWSTRRKMSGA